MTKGNGMNARAVLAYGTGLLVASAAAAVMAPMMMQDRPAIPPRPSVVEEQLLAFPMTLNEAIDMAQDHVDGFAKSAEIHLDRDPQVAEILVYGEGKAQMVTIDAGLGEVLEIAEVSRFPGDSVTGDWVETASGLKYFDIRVGEGAMPASDDVSVKLHFSAWFIDGTEFQNSYVSGDPPTIPLAQLLPGWTEGMLSMRVGGKRKLILSPELAFGEAGHPPTIPPGSIFVFDVELFDVVDYQTLPETLPGDPVTTEPVTSESGLAYYELVEGDGMTPPDSTATVRVHYTGWLTDGTVFDSSVERGSPIDFPLNGVIPGWTEGVGSMKVGGKRKLIVPADLGYGQQGMGRSIPPGSTLIFDVELIEIVPPAPPVAPPPTSGGNTGEDENQ